MYDSSSLHTVNMKYEKNVKLNDNKIKWNLFHQDNWNAELQLIAEWNVFIIHWSAELRSQRSVQHLALL